MVDIVVKELTVAGAVSMAGECSFAQQDTRLGRGHHDPISWIFGEGNTPQAEKLGPHAQGHMHGGVRPGQSAHD